MKILLLAFTLMVAAKLDAQTISVVKNDGSLKEVYNVLKTDTAIREGEYTRLVGGRALSPIVAGYYHNNLKDSLWQYFYSNVLIGEGHYKNGEKVGIWTGYTRGFERLKYDFSKDSLITYIPAKLDSTLLFRPITTNSAVSLDRWPIYINGMATFTLLLMKNARYPALALEANKQGEVILTFTINEHGTAGNYRIKNKIGYGIDDEVLRVMKQLDGAWVPGTVKGKPVAVECEMPFLFEINPPANVVHRPNQIVVTAISR
ncbi:energy transducer TonB [Inquilinus sp. KBS0705]|nr:energy transducer TonB [Inquilinus sp. KBS0705]